MFKKKRDEDAWLSHSLATNGIQWQQNLSETMPKTQHTFQQLGLTESNSRRALQWEFPTYKVQLV